MPASASNTKRGRRDCADPAETLQVAKRPPLALGGERCHEAKVSPFSEASSCPDVICRATSASTHMAGRMPYA